MLDCTHNQNGMCNAPCPDKTNAEHLECLEPLTCEERLQMQIDYEADVDGR